MRISRPTRLSGSSAAARVRSRRRDRSSSDPQRPARWSRWREVRSRSRDDAHRHAARRTRRHRHAELDAMMSNHRAAGSVGLLGRPGGCAPTATTTRARRRRLFRRPRRTRKDVATDAAPAAFLRGVARSPSPPPVALTRVLDPRRSAQTRTRTRTRPAYLAATDAHRTAAADGASRRRRRARPSIHRARWSGKTHSETIGRTPSELVRSRGPDRVGPRRVATRALGPGSAARKRRPFRVPTTVRVRGGVLTVTRRCRRIRRRSRFLWRTRRPSSMPHGVDFGTQRFRY